MGNPFAPWDYLEAGKGIPSEQCVPYYGTGIGIDVFKSGEAPKCRSECQVDFKETFAQDAWFIKGMGEGKYQLRQSSKNFEARAKQELFDNGPYVGTMHASRIFLGYKKGVFYKPEWCLTDGCTKAGQCTNHAVTLTGYTPKSWIGLNSWGASWADPKKPNVFEIGTCMIDYWMIPGKISASKCPSRSDCGGKTCEEWVDSGKTCGEIQKKHSKCDCSACNWQDGPGNFSPLCYKSDRGRRADCHVPGSSQPYSALCAESARCVTGDSGWHVASKNWQVTSQPWYAYTYTYAYT
jgi:hypothetical protein